MLCEDTCPLSGLLTRFNENLPEDNKSRVLGGGVCVCRNCGSCYLKQNKDTAKSNTVEVKLNLKSSDSFSTAYHFTLNLRVLLQIFRAIVIARRL